MTLLRDTLAVARKDVVAEIRARDALASTATLGAAALVLAALAVGPDVARLRVLAPALVGVVLAFATMTLADRLDAVDRADDALVALWLVLDDPRALFAGRVISLSASLAALELGLWLAAAVLLDVRAGPGLLALVPLAILSSVSRAAVATIVTALVGGSSNRTLLGPTLLLPILVPTLLAGVQAADAALTGREMLGWASVLAAEALLFIGVGLAAYPEAARPA